MKAIQIPRRGGPFELVERPIPEPTPAQILIRVEACGVCQGENVAIEGHWPNVQYPRIPGHEIIDQTVRFSVLTQIEPTVEQFPLAQVQKTYERMMKADVRFRAVLTFS